MNDSALRAILVFCTAGMIVAVSGLAVAAVGVAVGSGGPTMPGAFLGLFYVLCSVFGVTGAWLLMRVEDER